jgi:uncharacterized protein YfaS (alpha-2-macroglobulin family)
MHTNSSPKAPRGRRASALLNSLVLASLLLGQVVAPVFASDRSLPAVTSGAQMAQISSPASDTPTGLDITLSQGSAMAQSPVTNTVAASEPLSAEETQALLDRLPAIETEAGDQVEFNLPPDSLEPPTVAETIESTFPASAPLTGTGALTVEVQAGDLEVSRYAPEGEISMAPFLQVTFNQPMVALGTLAELAAEEIPVQLTPELPGVWKWLGTQTLSFEYTGEVDRFPMSTEYEAVIPAGTTSVNGSVLQEEVRWRFSTPAVTVVRSFPNGGPTGLDPLMFVAFNQLVDPAAVLDTIFVVANGAPVDVRLAAAEEVAETPNVASLAKTAGDGRWIAFRATAPLPTDATVNINIGPGTPSAEGPRTTELVQSFSFATYSALRITSARCSWGGSTCPLGSPFEITFNNPIDLPALTQAWVSATPEIPGMVASGYGNTISISGAMAGRTKYTVTVHGDVRDIFGQTLGSEESFTFTTDSAYPYLTSAAGNLVTVDPAGDPTFSVFSMNYPRLHIRQYAVNPDDWQEWQNYQRTYWDQNPAPPPGELVHEETVSVDGQDKLVETVVDLKKALGDRTTGHVVVIVDIPRPLFGEQDRNVVQAWIQVTQQAVDAFSDSSQLLGWVTHLADGTPIEGAQVTLSHAGIQGETDAEGAVRLDLTATPGKLLISTIGEGEETDVAFTPYTQWDYWGDNGWIKTPVQDELRWYVFDDRQMYRPGEEVHLKGWLRRIGMTPAGDVGLLENSGVNVRYSVSDPMGATIAEGSADLSNLDGFDFSFTIPQGANLGSASVYLTANGVGNVSYQDNYYSFQIQEFRRPEFAVSAQPETVAPYFLNEEAEVAVSAQYYAGGPLANADTTWTVSATPGSYSPPNWREFTFGTWTPWWWYGGDIFASYDFYGSSVQVDSSLTFTGTTDATGKHYLHMSFDRAAAPRPYTVSANAVVMDVNRQAWSSSTSLLVHPSEYYVGIRSESSFVEKGDPLEIEVIVTDVDGNPVPETAVTVKAALKRWVFDNGSWVQQDQDEQTCDIVSGNEPESCTFETTEGGEYRVWAEVRDDRERLNRSEFTRWVSGGNSPPARGVEQEEASLVPDKQEYAIGDIAEILVQSPFAPAEGLLTIARNGFVYTESFTVTDEDPTATLQIPIEEAYLPNITVMVELVGSAPRLDGDGNELSDLPERPAYASGQLTLNIPPISRSLALEVQPAALSLAPGDETSLDVVVTDAEGNPVEDVELAVVVVDEAILALTNYQLPDPLETFYRGIASGVSNWHARGTVVLLDPASLAGQLGGRGGGGGAMDVAAAAPASADGAMMEESAMAPMPTMSALKGESESFDSTTTGAESAPIDVRTNFNPLAVFAPNVRTDADGRATVEYTLPDNLTRYRVMVVAATDKQFGSAEQNITARLPLMVRPSAPRFLNFGDVFEFPVVIQNQTDAPMSVAIAMSTTNISLAQNEGQRVEVPANDRVEVRFPATTESAGTARFQVAVSATTDNDSFADASAGELPVYTPATTEAFATYGVIDTGTNGTGAVAQPMNTPSNVFPQFGGLEVSTSSTALSELTDAMIYLHAYPFECSEQIASRILSTASLRDVLTAFNVEGLPSPAEINTALERDIEKVLSFQNLDGGFPIWERGDPSIPYHSIYVTHALVTARDKDYAVPQESLNAARDFLRNIEAYYPDWYSEITKQTLSSYAVYVRHLMGDSDAARAREIYGAMPIEEQSLEALAWLWQAMSDDASSSDEVAEIRRHVNNSAIENASEANFITSYGDQEYVMLHSNRRTDAILLDALINDDESNPIIPKVVNGLMAARINGRWNNTQENTFVLLALDRYFNTYENVEPDFVARVWLGETYVAENTFAGYDAATQQTLVPMQYVVDAPENPAILLQKDGDDGRLYYRLGLQYAPTDLRLDPLEMGFTVIRTYEAVNDASDVTRDEEGTWHIKAGAEVRVRIQMVTTNRRYNVALVDNLPAGFEAINPALAISAPVSAVDSPRRAPMAGGGIRHGTSTRICATAAPKPLPPCCGMASIITTMSPEPPHREPSSPRPPKPKRCTRQRSLGAVGAILL